MTLQEKIKELRDLRIKDGNPNFKSESTDHSFMVEGLNSLPKLLDALEILHSGLKAEATYFLYNGKPGNAAAESLAKAEALFAESADRNGGKINGESNEII